MRYVCDAPRGETWFQIETEAEAVAEGRLMEHAVEAHFRGAWERAAASYTPPAGPFIERDIGLKEHIWRVMPIFLTLRDLEGDGLVTAMLPPLNRSVRNFRPIIVGRHNEDPYPEHGEAIKTLGQYYRLTLDRDRCYPYRAEVPSSRR
jgi:hypothetical protein